MKRRTEIKGLLLALCAVVVIGLTAGPVQATTYVWNFATAPGGDTGVSSKTYNSVPAGFSITATGYTMSPLNIASPPSDWTLQNLTLHNLFEKFTSGDPGETGLGLTGLTANEIQVSTLIQLDVSSLKSAGLIDLDLFIGSIQGGEGFAIYGSDIAAANGVTGSILAQGVGPQVIQERKLLGPIPNNFIWVTATSVDVLLDNGLAVTQTTGKVPEPISLILLGSGLAGAGLVRRFRRK